LQPRGGGGVRPQAEFSRSSRLTMLFRVTAGDPEILASGNGFVDLSSWRKVAVEGPDALVWLSRLCADSVEGLRPGRALRTAVVGGERSFPLDVTVAVVGGTLLVIQDASQDPSVWDVLEAHRAGELGLEDRTDRLALFSFPGRSQPPVAPGTAFSSPSCIGEGVDVFSMKEDRSRILALFQKVHRFATYDDLEAWRKRARPSSPPVAGL
jgi:hypothetical protein